VPLAVFSLVLLQQTLQLLPAPRHNREQLNQFRILVPKDGPIRLKVKEDRAPAQKWLEVTPESGWQRGRVAGDEPSLPPRPFQERQ
jgi:hypothetical protein